MKHYIQYFNCEKMGRFPNGADALLTTRMGVFTKLPSVKDSKGGRVFVIAGLGKPKRYYLWESFTVEDVTHDGTQYTIAGPGWVLAPPQPLQGKAFDAFKAACANFVSFRAIDDQPYRDTLRELADKYHLADVNKECEDFCTDLIKLEPKNGDGYYYRALVRHRLGKAQEAKDDFTAAIKLGTNFAQEAQAALTAPAGKPATGAAKAKVAKQVVAKGVFAQAAKAPAGVSDVAWRAVLLRRGSEELRQKLLAAYGGKCAVTGSDAEPALEAALIAEDGPDGDVTNALLLRADVRTLFELNLLRVHPRTKKVFLAEALRKTSYGRLDSRRIRLPEREEDRPSVGALEKRWEASAKAST